MPIPCQKCNQSPATVHVTDIVPPHGEKRERHLCENCAESDGITMKSHEPINTILAKFVQQKTGSVPQEIAGLACPHCGISFREFRAQGQLGCPRDYEVFSKFLTPLVERAHGGATRHEGKTPARLGSSAQPSNELAGLRRELKAAVEREDYENAARLRDQIRALRGHGD